MHLVLPLMHMSLAILPPILPYHCQSQMHAHQSTGAQVLDTQFKRIPLALNFSDSLRFWNCPYRPSELGLRVPWALCYELPLLHTSDAHSHSHTWTASSSELHPRVTQSPTLSVHFLVRYNTCFCVFWKHEDSLMQSTSECSHFPMDLRGSHMLQ